ncbi:hypothetical protein NDI54_06190 [Haloarcula sp. S1AR25-5A]|uniref:Sulfatase n=1 Tax=Haloarcula terrestris TaxID=2950533 RepID=A0AAE4JGY3_9EURY|nr:hypothetical protein [Haloarcula terrestris]MDS0220940.1 hypothetical protein [Haloarcula terrestris]
MQDWDICIILDGCRYDVFESYSHLDGKLRSRNSLASSTVDFLKSNFTGKDLSDTVYVTANPQLYRYRDEIETNLHDIIHIWKDDGWDEELGTVLPETVTEYAIDAAARYPKKKIIVHYMQPHYPFIQNNNEFGRDHLLEEDPDEPNPWYKILYGELNVSKQNLWDAYARNLELALPHVNELISKTEGKSVVTADHGNMFGERSFPIPIPEWGHPHGIFTKELVKVPWLIIDDESRRDIISEEGDKLADIDTDVDDRLRQLGYRS